jgi:hypothetical protein
LNVAAHVYREGGVVLVVVVPLVARGRHHVDDGQGATKENTERGSDNVIEDKPADMIAMGLIHLPNLLFKVLIEN